MTKAHQNIVAALLPLAINQAVKNGSSCANIREYGPGSVVVVVTGKERHKRVIGKAYLVTKGGANPKPLGIRGDHDKRAFNLSDVRPANGKEIVRCLRNLNAEQVKTVVCTLSGTAEFRSVLSGVIENGGGCDCD